VKDVVIEPNELVSRIKADHKIQLKEEELSFTTGKSTTGINGQFVFTQLLIDCLLRLKSSNTDKDELISCCENEYKENSCQLANLREFRTYYSCRKALWWYTRDSFFYKTLNAAMRKQDIHMLFLYRSFISDIHRQLQYNQLKYSVRVYRSQLMSIDELTDLQQYITQFISINSFLSTSTNRPIALFLMGDTTQSIDLERVLFEIDADPGVVTTRPFADISKYSCFENESEVLFSPGCIFRVNSITPGTAHVWTVQMTLCSDEEHDLKQILAHLKNQIESEEINLRTFGKILWEIGKPDLAEKYFIRFLDELTTDDPLLISLYDDLALIASQKGDYDKCMHWKQKTLQIKSRVEPTHRAKKLKTITAIGRFY
jgi:tetratricopeptide (TPR) repeat protein